MPGSLTEVLLSVLVAAGGKGSKISIQVHALAAHVRAVFSGHRTGRKNRMKCPQVFKAFAADIHGCNRTPIDAEWIVIALGEDDQGNPVELSISLKNSETHRGKLFVAATSELKEGGATLNRELLVEEFSIPQGPVTNVRLLSVKCELVPRPKELHETWPPTTL